MCLTKKNIPKSTQLIDLYLKKLKIHITGGTE